MQQQDDVISVVTIGTVINVPQAQVQQGEPSDTSTAG